MPSPLALRQITPRQRPGGQHADSAAFLSEIFATNAISGAAAAFALAHIGKTARPVLWVQDRLSQNESGRPYLPAFFHTASLLRVDVNRPADVLTAMEDGLRCKGLAAVVGEVWGDPRALSFSATKRLAVRSEAANLPCWLIRRGAAPNLSAARERWRVTTLPSAPHPEDAFAPGPARWRAELFRSRFTKPADWVVEYDGTAHHLDFLAPFRDGAVAGAGTADPQRAAR